MVERVLGVAGVVALAVGAAGVDAQGSGGAVPGGCFGRVGWYPVHLNASPEVAAVAEILAASPSGELLVYTDGENDRIGFVDITDPAAPRGAGVVGLSGEPTSVACVGGYALAVVNTSADHVRTSGRLEVVDIGTRRAVRSIELGGQPDSIAVSPDGRYGAVAIENERDPGVRGGAMPQSPPGFVVVVDLVGEPASWGTRAVGLAGLGCVFPEDPEPEFVDISGDNIAAVTLQENNHLVLIDLAAGRVIHEFSCGAVDLDGIDTVEDGVIALSGSLAGVAREPDGVAWVGGHALATADEGDLAGGSRGFTIFGIWGGRALFTSGAALEREAAAIGQYPEGRSENRGVEPEGVEFGRFGDDDLLFVGLERANAVAVYRLPGDGGAPELVQMLPASPGPEGICAIPGRGLVAVSGEVDDPGGGVRAAIMLYRRGPGEPAYPEVVSAARDGAGPIPWGALSGLGSDGERVYAVHSGALRGSCIYTLDVGRRPAVIGAELPIVDPRGVLRGALEAFGAGLADGSGVEPSALINADGTVNLDAQGIDGLGDGSFVVACRGGERGGSTTPGLVVFVGPDGAITRAEALERDLAGVAVTGGEVFIAFGGPGTARVGRFDMATGAWSFAFYAPDGGARIAGLTALGDGRIGVLECDGRGGGDAGVKRVYSFAVGGFGEGSAASGPAVLEKRLVRDLLAAGDFGAGPAPARLSGLAAAGGELLIINDNSGPGGNPLETRLLRVER